MGYRLNIFGVVQELQRIAEQADRERMSVWVDQFKAEYPKLALHIERCADFQTPQDVRRYLNEQDPTFALLDYVPRIDETITFLQSFIRERKQK